MVTIAGYHFLECSSHIKKSSLVKHKRRNSSECPSCSLPYNESELSLSLKVNCDHFHCKSSSDILLNNSWVPENVFFFWANYSFQKDIREHVSIVCQCDNSTIHEGKENFISQVNIQCRRCDTPFKNTRSHKSICLESSRSLPGQVKNYTSETS